MAARKAILDQPIIPGLTVRIRAWVYLLGLIVTAALTSFGVGSDNQALVEAGVLVGLVVVFIGAVNTPYELPNTASELVPWFTSERCFWLYRGVALIGTILAFQGIGSQDQWTTFTAALGAIFGLTVTTLRTSLVKAVNAPEVA